MRVESRAINIIEMEEIDVSKTIGAIFWIVAKIIQFLQERPSILGGNQKWKGAPPSFIRSETIIIVLIIIFSSRGRSILGRGESKIAKIRNEEARD